MHEHATRPVHGAATLARMDALLAEWNVDGDRRDVFLRCYRMMTANMHTAIGSRSFEDVAWVDQFLRRFAEFYFDALAAWESDASQAPRVWQLAHESTRRADAAILQHLLLGVNAHINYDLVLTVDELLAGEWHAMLPHERATRHRDYCRVNDIIASTIDAVQDDILSPSIPLASLLDRVMGRLDEYLISRLITSWRDHTWESAIALVDAPDADARTRIIGEVEHRALRMADLITPTS
jgi:hypothetical protein